MRKSLIFILSLITCFASRAAIVDTIQIFSASMQKNINTTVVLPESYASASAFPVVYLLHGYSDNHLSWISKGRGIEKAADQYNMIIVCPDGGYNSWYWDIPGDSGFQYETFVSNELIKAVDTAYKTIPTRSGRGITGLSMGGHGAFYLAFKHQDVFGAAGSMSGGVDIRPFPNNWDIAKRLGTLAEHPERWEKQTVINMLDLLSPNSLALIIDCGTNDFFFQVNENLHRELVSRKIPHDYIVRPGGHDWNYWNNSVKYQLLFMSNFFRNSKN